MSLRLCFETFATDFNPIPHVENVLKNNVKISVGNYFLNSYFSLSYIKTMAGTILRTAGCKNDIYRQIIFTTIFPLGKGTLLFHCVLLWLAAFKNQEEE